ncbi:hypothetical protein TNCT_609961 [Trichonephila clavata]|uniref:Secreted protein n=1 Tax=Trichonephila clavata TaxID=2740835 RepID=A0A8X6KSN5_TRICU|nr:hypothetical protein TNCT_609961 [Trichonephila clavata]
MCVMNRISVVCLLPTTVAKNLPKCRHPGAEESFQPRVTLRGTQPQLRPSWSEDVTDVRFRFFSERNGTSLCVRCLLRIGRVDVSFEWIKRFFFHAS